MDNPPDSRADPSAPDSRVDPFSLAPDSRVDPILLWSRPPSDSRVDPKIYIVVKYII